MRAESGLVVERSEVVDDLLGRQFASHISRERGDARNQKGGRSSEVGEDDPDVGVTPLFASDDEVGGCFVGLVGHLIFTLASHNHWSRSV